MFALYSSGVYDAFGKILFELLKHNLTAQTELFHLFWELKLFWPFYDNTFHATCIFCHKFCAHYMEFLTYKAT